MLLLIFLSTGQELAAHLQASDFSVLLPKVFNYCRTQPLKTPFGKYYLWPFVILGSVLTSHEDVAMMREKFDIISKRSSSGLFTHVRENLEGIWKFQAGTTDGFTVEGLGRLFRRANINQPIIL